jgi:hypothetical protein
VTADQTHDDLPEEIEEAAEDQTQGEDSASVDPFDPVALREDAASDYATADQLYHLPIRRASETRSFIRVHPGPDYRTNACLLAHEVDKRKTLYLVAPGLSNKVREEFPREAKLYRLFLAVTKQGSPFIWPQQLPSGGMGDSWHESGLAAAEDAMAEWLKVEGGMGVSSYSSRKPVIDYGEPAWPDITFRDALALAFKDRLIDAADHDVLRDLRGEI